MIEDSVDVVQQLARRNECRGMSWGEALRLATRIPIVDIVRLQVAQVELGNEWAQKVYTQAQLEFEPEEIQMEDVTCLNDRIPTETGLVRGLTVNSTILRLAAFRKADPDVGEMLLVVVIGNKQWVITDLHVIATRQPPIADDDFVMALQP